MEQTEIPLALIVDDEPLHRDFASAVLAAAGWRVAAAESGGVALERLAGMPAPALILMDLNMDGLSGAETAAAIRALPSAAASAPILAYTTTRPTNGEELRARGFDGFLPKPCTPAELAAAAGRWRPDDDATALDRLEATFGVDEIRAMTRRFAILLAEAISAPGQEEVQSIAHRIAGIAGTLGFAPAGRAWLAVSEGDNTAMPEARRQSRRALALIGRRRYRLRVATSV